MSKHKYLVLFRSAPAPGGPSASSSPAPSPAQMQQMYAAYRAWMEQFKAELLDLGDKLAPTGRVVTAAGVAEGPFVEAKELVGGYMIVGADSYDRAVEVVRACPAAGMPGAVLEVRELMGAGM